MQSKHSVLFSGADIAKTVLLLASDESGWITGQTLRANGGYI